MFVQVASLVTIHFQHVTTEFWFVIILNKYK